MDAITTWLNILIMPCIVGIHVIFKMNVIGTFASHRMGGCDTTASLSRTTFSDQITFQDSWTMQPCFTKYLFYIEISPKAVLFTE